MATAEKVHAGKGFLPILESASERHPEMVFFRVGTEDHNELAQAFEVKSIPAPVVVRERVMTAPLRGILPENVLEDLLNEVKDLDTDEVRREMADSGTRETG
jgi:thioredoxin 1